MKFLLFSVFLFCVVPVHSQEVIKGMVFDGSAAASSGLSGANVYWVDGSDGVITDFEGSFVLPGRTLPAALVISFVGFETDTVTVASTMEFRHILRPADALDQVTLVKKRTAQFRSSFSTANIIQISSDELLKAACCNLSESFETNPSIDVNFSDAITGTKQIKMLGLTSPYILITAENIPVVRGAAQSLGLSYVPGTWVESIQMTKGAGSVINGYESIAGQINAELQKPATDAPLFLNVFAAANGRQELNAHVNHGVTDRWSTGIYIHGNQRRKTVDRNDDDFLDTPKGDQINIMNRWQYIDPVNGWVSFINARILSDRKVAGATAFDRDQELSVDNPWGSIIDTDRIDLSSKLGYVNPELPYQSLGLQGAYSVHDQRSIFGLRSYDIEHQSAYVNLLYNSIISDTRHKIKTGLNATYDQYNEDVVGQEFRRQERALGVFFEYAYDDLDQLSLSFGLRADAHNLLGFFVTPRLHLKYLPWEQTTVRLSMGRGKRIPNIFSENLNLFASSRQINIRDIGGAFYGLDPEIAWNYGLSVLQKLRLANRPFELSFDVYRTDFVNHVVVDWEVPQAIGFYNKTNESWTQSYQIEASYSPAEYLDLRAAYKYFDINTAFDSGDDRPPLTPEHRVFANASYQTHAMSTGGHWKIDATINWLSAQRYPEFDPDSDLFGFALTPNLLTMNTQITKVFNSKIDWYLGVENITNVQQPNPVINATEPFGANFDATMVYGPIFGRMMYTGARFKL
ncbi:TonB-dependent receptor [Flavobacteriaceae bacterium]|nr:TonB-dependent receptor [Flavobacteriaceae bacterium]